MQVEASPSGTHTAACSVAGLLLAGEDEMIDIVVTIMSGDSLLARMSTMHLLM